MNLGEFKTTVAGYINRSPASFVRDGVDMLLSAVNDAKKGALRKHNFECLKDQGFIVGSSLGVEIATITARPLSLFPEEEPLLVKKIESCWQFESTTFQRIRQVPFIQQSDLHNIVPILEDATIYPVSNPVTFKQRAYVRGTKFFVTGLQTSTELLVDVVKSLPDYVDDEDTDFLLERYSDWMLFRTLMQLNAYLKETERIQVSKALLDQTWEEILQDDNERASNHNSANALD